jgi:DNA-binding NarL/FixJ family response regulator
MAVLVVDDQPLFRAALRRLLEATWPTASVAEADSGESAVAAARESALDMVIMDVCMPGLGGFEAADRIKTESPETFLVLVSATPADDLVRHANGCRADTIVWKGHLRPQLLAEAWSRHAEETAWRPGGDDLRD